jgi:hypothetical protein
VWDPPPTHPPATVSESRCKTNLAFDPASAAALS